MTKEELEKEAEVYADDKKHFDRQAQLYIVDGYLAGAEPREKRIAELTEYNETLMLQIQSLGKENSELKEQISTKDILIKELQEQKVYWKESSFDWRHKFFKLDKVKRLIKKDEQLTRAKEIIKEFMKYEINEYDGSLEIHFEELKKQAEQFLNNEVEK